MKDGFVLVDVTVHCGVYNGIKETNRYDFHTISRKIAKGVTISSK